ncbi:MAG: gamma-glutamylcyclotransferase [Desulfitobacterium hafniense]|nr:gamma-glutamylcyclotransferase [Desulfitobacterium hafniense]
MKPLFVYGTLMQGGGNHPYLEGQKYLGQGELKGYAMYDLGWYPCILPQAEEGVKGELYLPDAQALAHIDRLEGNGSLYNRKTVTVKNERGDTLQAWTYVWNGQVDAPKKVDYGKQPWLNYRHSASL